MMTFQSLNTGHFIDTFNALALLGSVRCLLVQRVNIADFDVKIGVMCRGEPIAIQMRLEISFFLKVSPRAEARCWLQSGAVGVHRQFHALSSA